MIGKSTFYIMSKITIDYSRIFSLIREIDKKNKGTTISNTGFDRVIRKWSTRYVAFTKQRYRKLSSGGGEWPRLKRKRKRGTLKAAKILIDTGTLFRAISPKIQATGAWIIRKIRINKGSGLRIGYGAQGKHPAGIGLQEIASFHQTGAGKLPVRRIVVEPTKVIVSAMAKDYSNEINRIKRKPPHKKIVRFKT